MSRKSSSSNSIAPNQSEASSQTTDFGNSTIPAAEKPRRVQAVFDSVAQSYDVMNDVMSLGIHRYWKDRLIYLISPNSAEVLVDIAGGTGDIAGRFITAGGKGAVVVDVNAKMIEAGRKKPHLAQCDRLDWVVGDAEALPVASDSADCVTIAFGLRNITHRQRALGEMFRIIKPGGRFYCLEFAHIRNPALKIAYDAWSRLLPSFGAVIAQDRASYRYLTQSIRRFPDQETLSAMLAAAGFARIKCLNLSGGIAAIHCGWKLD